MSQKYLQEVFSQNGNTPIYLRKADKRARRMHMSIMDEVRGALDNHNQEPSVFPYTFESFEYIGIEPGHYAQPLADKKACFLMEFLPHPGRPVDMVTLKFSFAELVDMQAVYQGDESVTGPIAAALAPLGVISEENRNFTCETILEYALVRAQRGMKPSKRPGGGKDNGPQPA